jgi:hypothetical protein
MRAPETTGLQRAGTVFIFKIFPSNQQFHELRHYVAMTEAAESLKAQLYSLGKLTTPRRENLKIQHGNEISKAN